MERLLTLPYDMNGLDTFQVGVCEKERRHVFALIYKLVADDTTRVFISHGHPSVFHISADSQITVRYNGTDEVLVEQVGY